MFLPGESQGRGSLLGCSLWGRTELDTTEVTQQQQQQVGHNFSWLQSPTAVILEPKKNKAFHCFCCFPICHEVMQYRNLPPEVSPSPLTASGHLTMALHDPRVVSGKSLLESSRHQKQKHPQPSMAGTVSPVAITLKVAGPQAGGQEGPDRRGWTRGGWKKCLFRTHFHLPNVLGEA